MKNTPIPNLTLHIIENNIQQNVLHDLFAILLENDPQFHFFFEPELIIRISSPKALEALQKRLTLAQYAYRCYSYPTPENNSIHEQNCGEMFGGIVIENLACFSHIFHLHAKAAILFEESTHAYYTSEIIRFICDESRYHATFLSEMFAFFSRAKAECTAGKIIQEDFKFLPPLDKLTNAEDKLITELKTTIRTGLSQVHEKYHYQASVLTFFERIIHTLFNMRGYSRQAESNYLKGVAEFYNIASSVEIHSDICQISHSK